VRCDGRRLARGLESEQELAAALARSDGEIIEFELLPRRS
jgi:hypothetical protein